MESQVPGLWLLGYSLLQYVNDDSWLTWGLLPALSGVLLVLRRPDCRAWRFLVVLVILLSSLHTLFQVLNLVAFKQSPLADSATTSTLSRDVLQPAVVTLLTASAFLRTASSTNSYPRYLVVGLVFAAMGWSCLQAIQFQFGH